MSAPPHSIISSARPRLSRRSFTHGRDQPYFTGERFVRRRVGLQLLGARPTCPQGPLESPWRPFFFQIRNRFLFICNPLTAIARVKVTKSAITVRLAPEIFFERPALEQPCP